MKQSYSLAYVALRRVRVWRRFVGHDLGLDSGSGYCGQHRGNRGVTEPLVADPEEVEVQPPGPHHTPQSLQPHLATSPDR
jgi:hypothetical protein